MRQSIFGGKMPDKFDIRFAKISDAGAFSEAFRAVAGPLTHYNDWAKRVEFEKFLNIPAVSDSAPSTDIEADAHKSIR